MIVYRCGQCGREAADMGLSMDGRHHIVRCIRESPKKPGRYIGHGDVLGTADPVELDAMMASSRDIAGRRAHEAHTRSGRLPRDCRYCRTAFVGTAAPHAL